MSGSSGNIYAPSGSDLSGANAGYNQLLPQLVQGAQTVQGIPGQAQALTSGVTANPYTGQAQTGANAASAYGTGSVVPNAQAGAGSLQGAGGANAGYVSQALAQGFDPQNALYNRGVQQTLDQQNAINAMSGVSNSPYGAGVTGQAMQDFNLGWDRQQLANQATAANTANTLTGAANTGFTGANALGNAAVTQQAGYSALPSQAYEQNILNQLQGLGAGAQTAGAATGVTDQALSQILAYLGYGTQATGAQQQQDNQTWGGIGNLLGSLGSAAIYTLG